VFPTVVAGLLLGVGVLSGCQGSDDPDPGPSGTATPSPSVSASPTATPTPAPPKAPAPKRTAKGAEAFVRYFWEVYNYTYVSQDTDLLASVSQAACVFCSDTKADVAKLRSRGAVVESGSVHVDAVAAPPEKVGSRILVVSSIHQDSGTIRLPSGQTEEIERVAAQQGTFALQWVAGVWQIHGISIEGSK
jgi:hypothetical protein